MRQNTLFDLTSHDPKTNAQELADKINAKFQQQVITTATDTISPTGNIVTAIGSSDTNAAYGLPDVLPAGRRLRTFHDFNLIEIEPHQQEGYCYVVAYTNLDSDNSDAVFTQRGILFSYAWAVLQAFNIPAGELHWEQDKPLSVVPWYITAKGKPARYRGRL